MMSGRLTGAMATALLGIGLAASATDVAAQTGAEYRRHETSRLVNTRQWYDTTLPFYRIQYPLLRHSPLADPAMAPAIRDAYLYVDTLMRSPNLDRLLQDADLRGMKHGSIGRLASYLFQMNDYNPVIFAQYADGAEMHRSDRSGSSLRQFSHVVYNHIRNTGGRQDNALYSTLRADYILRVKIRSVDPSFDEGQLENHYYRVTAEVLDTLKGQCFQPYERLELATAAPDNRTGSIQFQYTPDTYLQPTIGSRDRDDIPFPYTIDDPAFLTGEQRFGMRPGQEAIIFLRHDEHLVDAEHDYYYLHLDPWASNSALPIVDGRVRDLNHIWSDQDLLSYHDWRHRFLAVRSAIMNAGG